MVVEEFNVVDWVWYVVCIDDELVFGKGFVFEGLVD